MATDEETQNPFTRPGFIAAAVVIALVVVLGVIVAIVNATRSEPDPEPVPSSTTSAPSTTPPVSNDGGAASICKLGGKSDEVPVKAPEALWEYQGTTAYPTSETYGPGADDPAGFRFCFQHSPTGALFAAANALAQGSDPAVSQKWVQYAAGDGPYKEALLESTGSGSSTDDTRLMIQGFRILNYDEKSARVDIGSRGTSQGQTITVSGVYELVWQDGDWKISGEVPEPLNVAVIPDLSGYIAWGE